jgi:hypothetical protein
VRATLLYPGLVAVLWQELSGVQIYGRPKGLGFHSVAGSSRCLLEGFDIHPQRTIGARGELLAVKEQVARGSGGGAATSRG